MMGSVEDYILPTGTGGAPTPDAFGNRIEVVGMEEFGGAGGNKVYFYKIKGLAGAAGGNAEVTAVWDRSAAGLAPVPLRARVIVADHWRRAANYDAAADALRTTDANGVPGTYRPGGGYYGLLVVEGPSPSAFFEPGSRPGYVRSNLPINWFDWGTMRPDHGVRRSLLTQVDVTVHLAGIGSFPITTDDPDAPAARFNINPMASAPIAHDIEPNDPVTPADSNPRFGGDWRMTSWVSFRVTPSGEYQGTANGGLIEGPPDSTDDDLFPPAPLQWTNGVGVALEGRIRQAAGGGRVRTATVYSGEDQRTDFTNAAGVITPSLETWALGANPLQRIGTNTTARMFTFRVASTLYFVRPGTSAEISAEPATSLNVASTQVPSGQTASGGIVRPPTHLAVRAAAVAVIPKAVYRFGG